MTADRDPARIEQAARALYARRARQGDGDWHHESAAGQESYRAQARAVLDAYDADPIPDPFAVAPPPWHTDDRVIRDGNGAPVFKVDTEMDDRPADIALAALIVEAVNAHAAQHASATGAMDIAELSRLDDATRAIVDWWDGLPPEDRGALRRATPRGWRLLTALSEAWSTATPADTGRTA